MSDNPFAEPGDDDRTVIRPMPGVRRAIPPPAPQSAPVAEPSGPPAITLSPLIAAASPVLQLLDRIGATRRPPDMQALRQRVVQDLNLFDRSGRDAGIPLEMLRPAHYALCASIDDVVLNAPWGAASGWTARTLVATFHPGARADAFFDQLRHVCGAADKFMPVIELMYLCLSLGFMGRYREGRGQGELERIRAGTHAVIAAQRPTRAPELSPHWQGVAAPYTPGGRGVPVWVALAASASICGALLFWTVASLNAASDAAQARVLTLPPAHMPQLTRAAVPRPLPPAPPPPEPTMLDRLRVSLQPDIDRGAVSVLGTPVAPVIRVPDRGMFAPASAVVQNASVPLLERIATALRNEGVSVRVIDYTDNQPVRSVQFPSNFQLSAARAKAVRDALARIIGDSARLIAEGRADADPIAPNTTADGREQNRRIELVLRP